jgi:AraC-like DNA-binding protein
MTGAANSLTARATKRVRGGQGASAVQFRALVDAFERLGYGMERLLAEIGVRRCDLDDPDERVPLELLIALFERTQRERPLKNPWAKLAAATPIGAYQLLDYLIVSADTVGDGIRQLERYARLALSGFSVHIHDDEDPIRVEMAVAPAGLLASVEYGVTLLVRNLRVETDDRVTFEWTSFIHEPEDVGEMESVLGCPVRACASWSGIAVSRSAWNLPLRRRDAVLRDMLQRAAEAALQRSPALDSTPFDVRRVLSRLARGKTEIGHVARALGTSVRTLQRRLSSAGLSYHGLLDGLRRETAKRSIAESSLSIGEIAYLVGYSEPAPFHRAFKRWTGLTPRAYRRCERERRRTSVSM